MYKAIDCSSKQEAIQILRNSLISSGKTLSSAINEKGLYFRVSIIGSCNLNCSFCHNEGAPHGSILNLSFATSAIKSARNIGFTRVQFTGGEPLLNKQIVEYVLHAKNFIKDIGITTNGTNIKIYIQQLIDVGLNRIHLSLQHESLSKRNNEWIIPDTVYTLIKYQHKINFRINLPVPVDELKEAQTFIAKLHLLGCDVKVFLILPKKNQRKKVYPMNVLTEMIDEENKRSYITGRNGTVLIRKYLKPKGMRCNFCSNYKICLEQSHSLRLGADRVLRPCLVDRSWDIILEEGNMHQLLEYATILALDF